MFHVCPSDHSKCVTLSSVSGSHSVHLVDLQPLHPRILPDHTKEEKIVMTRGYITQKNLNHPHKQLFDCSAYTDTEPRDVQWSRHGKGHVERQADWKAV